MSWAIYKGKREGGETKGVEHTPLPTKPSARH